MTFWVDAHLSPHIARWLVDTFEVEAAPVRDLNLRDAEDVEIFEAARSAGVVVMTKDRDFIQLLERLGPPPQVIWLTCGNTSNGRLKEVLAQLLPDAISLLAAGEPMVEISDLGR
ncbi:MAG: DUF5615 family PIN-like protein [Armatimonadetes bacterium]|nr:DUF5615 family PIN-like protein [Armatimonadota bacterium]